MADLVIGGNTHKNIDYVKFKRADGTTATFYDDAKKNAHSPSAAVSVEYGKKGIAANVSTVVEKLLVPTAKLNLTE